MSLRRLNSPEALERLRDQLRAQQASWRARVLVCMTGCRSLGAAEVAEAFREKVAAAGLDKEVAVVNAGCHGPCAMAPAIVVEPWEYVYGGVKPSDVDEILEVTLGDGKPVERLCASADGETASTVKELPFFKGQRRDVLAHCGRVDPMRIEDAIARGAYSALARVLASVSPEALVAEVEASGLRGRGGAGFPAGVKWRSCREAAGGEKYLVCNADEGDPGAFMDRALLEGVPHQVLEGMLLAAYAVGASRGFVYVRAEYPIAVEHMTATLEQARECGLLGQDILGSGFDFDTEIRMGAGAFVCGEETALIASLEGSRGMPRPRPPYPAQRGYMGRPTLINNVETLANLPLVVNGGAKAFASVGTRGSAGDKIFALAGKVKNTGLVEVPLGTTLRQIVFDIGGGVPDGRSFKAAQMGGPSGGCVPAEFLDLPIDYESVKQAGAIMGSGGLVVMDDRTCMPDVARYFLECTQNESCGKCTPCRVGTRHMLGILERICAGDGREEDLDELECLAEEVKAGSLCGLGQTAPNPVLTTLRYFRDEYTAHIRDNECPARVCPGLFQYAITPQKCIGCGRCLESCPVDAVSGKSKSPHIIDTHKCIFCGACHDVCPVSAVDKVAPAGVSHD